MARIIAEKQKLMEKLYSLLGKSKAFTIMILLLNPFITVFLMEGITGNLLTLSKAGICLDVLISGAVLLIFILLFEKANKAGLIHLLFLTALALVQYYVYRFRGRSFTLSDLRTLGTAAEVAGNYSYLPERRVAVCLFLVCAWGILLKYSYTIRLSRFRILRILVAVGICFGAYSFLSDRELVSRHGSLKLEMWNIDKEYRHKGVLLMLASEVQYLQVPKPENYSVDQVEKIAEDYAQNYDARKQESMQTTSVVPENLIVIMNESFADLRILGAYEDQLSVLDGIDSLQENVRKGYLNVPVFGGGTANTEYEVLTGNCMAFWDNWTIAYQVYAQETEYGMARTLKKQGYDTLAMHPHNPLNYNREAVYGSMGFDTFLSRENWDKNYKSKIRKFVSDEASFNYLAHIYDRKDEDTKLFTFLLTMQNHSPFQTKGYEPTVSLDLDQEYPQAEEYLSLIRESDQAFVKLVQHFETVEAPTMIVMFGDHMPNLLDGFYDALAQRSGLSAEEFDRKKYMTPYVIWTNYELPAEEIPVMGASFFGSYILELAGVGLSEYDKMIRDILEEIPAINENEVMLSDGSWVGMDALSEAQSRLLNDYEILQYNEVFGGSRRVSRVFLE